ncbi:glycine zipper domain-containing protein [Siccirubricoccus phaeus]|uniref:glycine zipper domain-containing protein n=1 Tax=Siccirubricoccus phaeus TaxID=2595053 RepID=UPI001F48EA8D|nr:glycine zipper domain-containing protein [Siccirubricoccus phaeus]
MAMTKLRGMAPAAALLAAVSLGGCENATRTERNVGTGALGGAALGGLIGSFSGNLGWGALLGTAAGAGAGYLYEQSERSSDRAYQQGVRDARGRRRGY